MAEVINVLVLSSTVRSVSKQTFASNVQSRL